jgi:hypothetical protein
MPTRIDAQKKRANEYKPLWVINGLTTASKTV